MDTTENPIAYPLSTFEKLSCLGRRKHGHAANLASACFRFDGPLDPDRLARAVALLPTLVPRLGCAVVERDGELLLQPAVHPVLETRRVLLASGEEAEAAQLVADEADRAIDVRTQMLVRSTLVSLGPQRHWWLLSCHALAAEARGCETLYALAGQVYAMLDRPDAAERLAALAAGAASADGDPGYPGSSAWTADHDYWSAAAGQDQDRLNLRKGRQDQPARSRTVELALPAGWAARYAAFSATLASDHDSLFAALVLVLLHRYSGSGTVAVGLAQPRNLVRWAERPLGLDFDNVPLAAEIRGEESFAALADRVAADVRRGRQHRRYPQAQLVAIGDSRKQHEHRLFEFVVYGEHAADGDFGAGPVARQPLPYRGDYVPRLGLVRNDACGLLLRLEFLEADLDPGMAPLLLDSLATLLGDVLDSHGVTPMEDLALVSPAQRERLLGDWAGVTRAGIPHCCVHELFEQQVARTPQAIAAVYEDEAISYAELDRRADVLARHLRNCNIGPDVMVGIFVERSVAMVVTVLAILKAGGAFVPLDIDFPETRLRYIIEDAQLATIVTQRHLAAMLPAPVDGRVLTLDEVDWQAPAARGRGCTPDNLAYVIYTSGSTGNPKGVLVEHKGMINHTYAIGDDLCIDAGSRVLQFASLTFDASIAELFTTLARGATLYVASHQERLTPDLLSDLVARRRLTHAILPPVLLKYLSLEKFQTVGQLQVVGESTPLETARVWARGRRLSNGYGPTENTVHTSLSQFEGDSMTIGRPLHNVRGYVVDHKQRLVPVGAAGELCIGGAGVTRGYLNQPELTAAKFIPDVFSGQGRLYKSGDLVRWLSDGDLDFIGRRDQQVKIRGLRIELEEVEAHLQNIEGVAGAVVVVRETAVAGEPDDDACAPVEKCLVAYLVLDRATLTEAAIRAALAAAVPKFMVPAHLFILDAFPLTHSRKIDKKALKAIPLERTSDAGR